jgi:hypothetical protein
VEKLAPGLEEYIEKYNIEKDSTGNLILYKATLNDDSSWYAMNFFSVNNRKYFSGVYRPGALVKNSRGAIEDRNIPCGEGLHVGTFDCACEFATLYIGQDAEIIKVSVNPYNVACVPHCASHDAVIEERQKIIVRELIVIEQISQEVWKALK